MSNLSFRSRRSRPWAESVPGTGRWVVRINDAENYARRSRGKQARECDVCDAAHRSRGPPRPRPRSADGGFERMPAMEPSAAPGRTRNVAVLLAGGVGVRVGPRHPQAADQGRRQDDPRAHARRAADAPARRRGHRDDGARATSTPCARSSATAATTKVTADPRGRRHPQRHDLARAGRASATSECHVLFHDAVRPLRQRRGSSPSASRRWTTYAAVDVAIPSADTIIEVGRRQHHPRHPAAGARCAAARPRRRSGPRSSARPTSWRTRIPTSPPPTTAPWCCATCPTCRSGSSHGDERNMKVTEPIDVYLADKLFQLTSNDVPAPATDDGVPRRARGQDDGGLRRQLRHRRRHRRAGRRSSAPTVFTFSRSSTGTHVERRERHRRRRSPGASRRRGRIDYVVNTAGVLPRGDAARDQRGDDLRRDRDQLPRAGVHRAGVPPAT